MLTILTISFRNFLRQRRRNLMIGGSIAFGIMIMMIANGFSNGLSDNILNKMVYNMTGHVSVQAYENGRIISPIFRNGANARALITNADPNILEINEDIGGLARIVGNGKGDYAWLVGSKIDESFTSMYTLKSGSLEAFNSYQNPLILTEQKAKNLNVDIGDSVNIRVSNVNGQTNTGTFYVAAITKNVNMFMNYAVFSKISALKPLLGYKDWESGSFKLRLKNPKLANQTANTIHAVFEPSWIGIPAKVQEQNNMTQQAWILPYDPKTSTPSAKFSPSNEPFSFSYSLKHPEQYGTYTKTSATFTSDAVIKMPMQDLIAHIQDMGNLELSGHGLSDHGISDNKLSAPELKTLNPTLTNIYLVPKENFFKAIQPEQPEHILPGSIISQIQAICSKNNINLNKNWQANPRTKDPLSFEKKMKALMRNKSAQPTIDVASMYETAKDVIAFEATFNLIVFIVSIILFSIIMIGVLNSLRMTIKERTKEIGTLRAIGLKQRQLLWIFLFEMLFLVCISSVIGIFLSFAAMKGLSLIPFAEDNPLNMIMVEHRLYFLPTLSQVVKNFGIVLVFTLITVFFPCRNAAKMDPCKALRH